MLTFNKRLDSTLSIVAAVALIVMMLHVVAHALLRYSFNAPIDGTNEIVAYWYLPAVALLGIPAAQLQNEQITVTLAIERMNPISASIFKVFACILGALTSIGFAWYGFAEAMKNMAIGSTAGVTDIITWPIYFLVPIVFVMLAILYVIDMFLIVRTREHEVDLVFTGEKAERDIEDSVL